MSDHLSHDHYTYKEVLDKYVDLKTKWILKGGVEVPYSLHFSNDRRPSSKFFRYAVIKGEKCKFCQTLNEERVIGEQEIYCITSTFDARCAMCICLGLRFTDCKEGSCSSQGSSDDSRFFNKALVGDQSNTDQVANGLQEKHNSAETKNHPRLSDERNQTLNQPENKKAKLTSADTIEDNEIHGEQTQQEPISTNDEQDVGQDEDMETSSDLTDLPSDKEMDETIEKICENQSSGSDNRCTNEEESIIKVKEEYSERQQQSKVDDVDGEEENMALDTKESILVNNNEYVQAKLNEFKQLFNDFTSEKGILFIQGVQQLIIDSNRAKELDETCKSQRINLSAKDEEIGELQRLQQYYKGLFEQRDQEYSFLKARTVSLEKEKEIAVKNEKEMSEKLHTVQSRNLDLEKQIREKDIALRSMGLED